GEVVGRFEAIGPHVPEGGRGDVSDVALVPSEFGDLGRVDVESEDRIFAGHERASQGQPNVAQADNPDPGRPGLNAVPHSLEWLRGWGGRLPGLFTLAVGGATITREQHRR